MNGISWKYWTPWRRDILTGLSNRHFPTSLVSSLLLQLELEGKVAQLPGKLFLKVIR